MSTLLKSEIEAQTKVTYEARITDGLEVCGIFCDETSGQFERNFAPNKRPFAMYGDVQPSLNGKSGRFRSTTDYLATRFPEPKFGTVIAVMATPDTLVDNAHRPGFFGTWLNPPLATEDVGDTFGVSSIVTSSNFPNGIKFNAGRGTSLVDDNRAECSVRAEDASVLQLYSFRFDTSTNVAINHTIDDPPVVSPITTPRFQSRATMLIGSVYRDYEGLADISMIMMYSHALTDAALAHQVDDCRAFMQRLGVTV